MNTYYVGDGKRPFYVVLITDPLLGDLYCTTDEAYAYADLVELHHCPPVQCDEIDVPVAIRRKLREIDM